LSYSCKLQNMETRINNKACYLMAIETLSEHLMNRETDKISQYESLTPLMQSQLIVATN
jgi:hypothetical protein